jgi:hypothetical protein
MVLSGKKGLFSSYKLNLGSDNLVNFLVLVYRVGSFESEKYSLFFLQWL